MSVELVNLLLADRLIRNREENAAARDLKNSDAGAVALAEKK
jgi:hypothetical protein